MALLDDIKRVFIGDTDTFGPTHVAIARTCRGYEITVGAMYAAPPLAFAQLKALSEMFGTEWIDANGYAESGCETCDYGSDYGHVIELRDVTRRLDELADATT